MSEDFDNLYKGAYEISLSYGCTVPLLYRPYDSNRKVIDMNIWYATVEHKTKEHIRYCGSGTTQEDALIDLCKVIMEL